MRKLLSLLLTSSALMLAQTAAVYVKTDTATQGTWKGTYGADGYSINSDSTTYPAYTQMVFNGSPFVWTQSTTDVRATQKGYASDRIASGWYTWANQTIDLNITDSNFHQAALYCLDWDGAGARSEQIDVLDGVTGAVLDTRTITGFQNGQYVVWNLKGHVKLKITWLAGANGVVSGLFFGPASQLPPTTATATYVKTDTTTQGSWKSVYGGDGYSINYDSTTYPSYVQMVFNGTGFEWADPTSDVRALQKGNSSDRLAAGWYTWTNQTIDVNITDGSTRQAALYCLDWDGAGARAERIDIIDAVSNAVLDTRTITGFQNGQYVVWNLSGHVKIKITLTAGANAVISGLFFGGPSFQGVLSNLGTLPGVMLIDDTTGQLVQKPTSLHPYIAVRLRSGKTVNIKRADDIQVSRLDYAREPIGGNYAYHFTIDSRQIYILRMGEMADSELATDAVQEQPKGWAPLGAAWAEIAGETAEDSVFSITSKWKPGLLSLYLMGQAGKEPAPLTPVTDDNQRIVAAASIFQNSLQKFVIGPAIPPDATQETLDALVQRWVEDYGFGFLRPVMETGITAEVNPTTDLERDALKCLQEAYAALPRK